MLRIERTFEERGILDELDAYNPLVPDGTNFKATMMLEYPDPGERSLWLGRLIGVEDHVWMQVSGHPRVYAVADEDLERDNDEKTSSVHFLRFELAPPMVQGLRSGGALALGVDHALYTAHFDPLPAAVRDALVKDLS